MKTITDKLISLAKKEHNITDPLFFDYLKIFYAESVLDDFDEYSSDSLIKLCFASFELFSNKLEKQFKVKIYNPSIDKDGFESDFTVLDVINNDSPFLVDSVIMYFDKIGVEVKNVIHPIFSTNRSKKGSIEGVADSLSQGNHESVIQLHMLQISSSNELKEITASLESILDSTHLVVNDWKKMVSIAREAGDQLDFVKSTDADISEFKEFVSWLCENKFIFLGFCQYDLVKEGKSYDLAEVSNSRLGIFRSKYQNIVPNLADYSAGDIPSLVKNPYFLEILKSRHKSQIHRNVNVERIRIQRFNQEGEVIGEYRFIGLFTSSVYYQSADLIPIIRKKITKIIDKSKFKSGGHSFKDLVSILESYPRDELFQIEEDDLLRISLGIVAMSGRPLVRFFARNDKFERFVSCLIFIPRDNFNTYVKSKIHDLLENYYDGEILSSYIQVTDSNLTRLQIIVRTDEGIADVDYSLIESKLVKISASWVDDFRRYINDSFDRKDAKEIINNYQNAFSVSYTHKFSIEAALYDIEFISKAINSGNGLAFSLYKSKMVEDAVEIKIYSTEDNLQLSNMMPVLDSFGFNIIQEYTYTISPKNEQNVWIYYFTLHLSKSGDKLTDEIVENFEHTIAKIYEKKTQFGPLNRMIVAANLNNRQISLLRAYSKYLYQAGFRYNQSYISDVLVRYRDITKLVVQMFETKFNPEKIKDRSSQVEKTLEEIDRKLSKVNDSSDDVVLRRFANIVDATIRTNFFQKNDNGNFKDHISLKFNCSKIQDLVLPVPFAEIFVFSNEVEGVHLRGGKVARGGLRWSDRHEDFRTEILGLVKAQMTKNAVIVPVGSKGGFIVKSDISNMDRERSMDVVIGCYKTFLRGILDITDNVIDGKIAHPQNVIRYDDADPYLVVAADKGTATFSDVANDISAEYNFWLGDAFASGGSVGYDHKKMGITAKGAWVSVKRHFSEMGTDTQSQDFTCVGIGDLSGDVFGNGMLLSKHIKLVGAFNHMHIFIDPDPDTAISYKERKRMFGLSRSSWLDYNKDLISKGGGIFDRSAKTIKISKEAKKALDIEKSSLTPDELIKAILKSPVDLLWNGGIGTYVKSSTESDMEVGDRINDNLRVNGNELRCKVIGEGGNLGLTQKGRIEYALSGGRINTDSLDNSAGVDCSDHEVNIKIALSQAVEANKISIKKRNEILESMSDNVEESVLSNNMLQSQTVTISESKGFHALGDYSRFLTRLEKIGLLNRAVEFLPTDKQIEKRQSEKIGMTRPELSVMLSYAKMDIYNNIIGSKLVQDKYFERMLLDYFPKLLQDSFKEEILSHQLRCEIIATQITNMVVGRVGISFVSQIARDNGFEIADIVRNIIIVCESFRLEEVWQEIESLDNKEVPVQVQVSMFAATNKLLERSVLWLLRNVKSGSISVTAQEYRSIIDDISDNLFSLLAPASRASYDGSFNAYKKCGVGSKLANKVASIDALSSAYDIIEVSKKLNTQITNVSQIYFKVGTRLHLKWLRNKILTSNTDNYWQRISTKTILEDLYHYQMKITSVIVEHGSCDKEGCDGDFALDQWIKTEDFLVGRYDRFINDFKSQANPDLSMFIVALNRIKALISKS